MIRFVFIGESGKRKTRKNGREKEVAERLEAVLRESHPKRMKSTVGHEPELDSEVKRRLEDLGYSVNEKRGRWCRIRGEGDREKPDTSGRIVF